MAQQHRASPNDTCEQLSKLAAKEGISLNAYLVPFLKNTAAGRLVRGAYYLPPSKVRKVA